MSDDSVLEVACPSCGSALNIAGHSSEVVCSVCNGQFLLAGHLCPMCHTYHKEEEALCTECDSPLVRRCRECGTVNWTGDDTCKSCGHSIDMLTQVQTQSRQSTAERLNRQMHESKKLMDNEAMASERRMAELMAIEEARQAELVRQRLKRKQQEQRMLLIVFTAVLLFFVVLSLYAILSSLG